LLALNEKVKKELKELDDIYNYQYSKDGIKILDLSSHRFLDKEGSPTWHLEAIKMLWTDGIGLDLDKFSGIRWAFLVHRRGGKSRLMDLISAWLLAKYPDICIVGGMKDMEYFKTFHNSIFNEYIPVSRYEPATLRQIFKNLEGQVDDYKLIFNLPKSKSGSSASKFYFPNNSEFNLLGVKTGNIKGRGRRVVLFYGDEVAYLQDFNQDVIPDISQILKESKGGQILISTPGTGWYESYVRNLKEDSIKDTKTRVFNYTIFNSGMFDEKSAYEMAESDYRDLRLAGWDHTKALHEVAQYDFNFFKPDDNKGKEDVFPMFVEKEDDYIIPYMDTIIQLRSEPKQDYVFYTVIDYSGGSAKTTVNFYAKKRSSKQLLVYDEIALEGSQSGVENTVKEMRARILVHGIEPQVNLLDSQANATALNFSETEKESYLSSYNTLGNKLNLKFGIINRKFGGKDKDRREEIAKQAFEKSPYKMNPITLAPNAPSVFITDKCTDLIEALRKSKVTRPNTARKSSTYHFINEDSTDNFYYGLCEAFGV